MRALVCATIVAGAVYASGCSDAGAGADAAVPDLAARPLDLAAPDSRGGGLIGEPCQSDGDCGEGLHPVCFVDHVSGFAAAPTPNGYCSATCGATQYDCGSAACEWFPFAPPHCFRPCAAAADCRTGYACLAWVGQVCFPSAPFLDCDPTAGDGACTTGDGKPGGCYRLALGDGLAGRCGARCDVVANACAADPHGVPQRCRPVNDALFADGGVGRGNWQGPICDLAAPQTTQGRCLYAWSKPPKNYDVLCVDGWDCNSERDPYGDEDCFPMCYLDGGAPAGDAGVPPCRAGVSCFDAHGLGANPDPSKRVGLCLP